jgi:hypothetical protein
MPDNGRQHANHHDSSDGSTPNQATGTNNNDIADSMRMTFDNLISKCRNKTQSTWRKLFYFYPAVVSAMLDLHTAQLHGLDEDFKILKRQLTMLGKEQNQVISELEAKLQG